jgi:hypothetical protein
MIQNKFINTLTREQAYALYETHAELESTCTEFWEELQEKTKQKFLMDYAKIYRGYDRVKDSMKLFHACCMEEIPYRVLKAITNTH